MYLDGCARKIVNSIIFTGLCLKYFQTLLTELKGNEMKYLQLHEISKYSIPV